MGNNSHSSLDGLGKDMGRREWLHRIGLVSAGLVLTPATAAALVEDALQPTAMTVFKSPTCGCCTLWVQHVEKAGFRCTVRDVADLNEVKRTFGIPRNLESCHTAQIGPWLIEGHVPADLIQKLLKEKPTGLGLAVPGMPIGSPGMEGGTPERYNVLLFDRAGKTRVYATR